MITNWYTINVSPEFLSDRLRAAYSMWFAVAELDAAPDLAELVESKKYDRLKAYVMVLCGLGTSEGSQLTCSQLGDKISELFSAELEDRPFEDFLTDAGRSLANEVIAIFKSELRPVHVRVANSNVISRDVEIMVFPIAPGPKGDNIALMVYDF